MPPSAGADELRAAYRARARRLHPDTPGGSAAAMAELNEAWRVLSDPSRRAVYDAHLRSASTRYAPTHPWHDAALDEGRHGPPRVRGLTWIVLLVVLASIFVFTAYAAARRDPAPPGIDGYLQVGSCVVLEPLRPAREVPCEDPHDGIVVTLVPLAGTCPGRLRDAVTPDGTQTVCVRDP